MSITLHHGDRRDCRVLRAGPGWCEFEEYADNPLLPFNVALVRLNQIAELRCGGRQAKMRSRPFGSVFATTSPFGKPTSGPRAHYTAQNSMLKQVEEYDDDEMSEILRLALHKQGGGAPDQRQRLLAVADELGISHDAVAQAEVEYRQKASRQQRTGALYKRGSQCLANPRRRIRDYQPVPWLESTS